jgi:signal transduction histidine kinase
MNRLYFYYLLIFLNLLLNIDLCASDTLYIKEAKNTIEIYDHISIFEDPHKIIVIDKIIKKKDKYPFIANISPKLNFGYSMSTFWLQLVVKNDTKSSLNYILEISNPDLDYISFYEVQHDSVLRTIHTGELADVGSREIYHRNFIFHTPLEPGENYTYYLSVNNNGHSCTIPIEFRKKTYFERYDYKIEIFNWLIYGLLIFIIIFNFYLYWTIKDKVNLYYSLSLFFAIIFLLQYEGYFYFINPPAFVEKIKYINPSLYVIFLLTFTQTFINYYKKLIKLKSYLNLLKGVALIAPFFYILKYPLSLIADIGFLLILLTSFVIIIILAIVSYKKDYLPSQIFLTAYIVVFMGLFIHLLKELNFINPNFFTINSIKIGLTVQYIILTIAVLERFRINQQNAQQTIQNNLVKIELQNKEFEIINTELEKLALAASETDNSIAIYDNSGRLEWGNAGFEKLYEADINDLIKKNRDNIEFIIPNDNICLYVNKCQETKLPVVFETPVIIKNKKELWVQTTLTPFIRSGKIRKIIAIDSDITSLKTYESELETAKEKAEESDRLKTAFLHNISHEIRTPMNAIVGFSGFLSNPDLGHEKRRKYTDIIVQNSNQLLSIITDIINIASIETGQERIHESEINLNSILSYIHEQFLIKAKAQNIGLNLKPYLPYHDENIITDETKLVQVLTNLIDNALKFTKQGYVNFGYTIKDNDLEFFVEDTGIGIVSEMYKKIFKRFNQVENTIARQYGGSGLGLSISKAYVELLGGRIWLTSELNKGSTFYFTIPIKRSKKSRF